MGRLPILPCPQGRIDETNKEQTRTITERTKGPDR
jgi:hypothetical protein